MALDTFTALQIACKLDARLVLPSSYAGGAVADARRIVRVSGWGIDETKKPGSTPAPVAIVAKEYTVASSEIVIDLTAAPIIGAESAGVPAASEDLTGKNLTHCFFSTRRTSGTNAAAIVIKAHATNGYDLFGASGLIVLPADSYACVGVKTAGRDPVAGADKIIHCTGTDGDKLRVILVFEA